MNDVIDEKDQTPNLAWLTMVEILALKEPEHRFSALSLCTDLDLDSSLARAIAMSLDVPGTREDSEWLRIATSLPALQHRRDRNHAKEKREHLAAKKRPLSDRDKMVREVLKLDRHGRKA